MSDVGHTEARTLHELAYYGPHGPRESDPHFKIFHQARKHLIDVLGVGCWIGGATKTDIEKGLSPDHLCYGAKGLEAHHNVGEFAGLSKMDWQKVAKDFPLLGIHSNEDFLNAAESEGGLRIICSKHHRSPYHGIHSITEPVWKLNRYAQKGWDFSADPSTLEHVKADEHLH